MALCNSWYVWCRDSEFAELYSLCCKLVQRVYAQKQLSVPSVGRKIVYFFPEFKFSLPLLCGTENSCPLDDWLQQFGIPCPFAARVVYMGGVDPILVSFRFSLIWSRFLVQPLSWRFRCWRRFYRCRLFCVVFSGLVADVEWLEALWFLACGL